MHNYKTEIFLLLQFPIFQILSTFSLRFKRQKNKILTYNSVGTETSKVEKMQNEIIQGSTIIWSKVVRSTQHTIKFFHLPSLTSTSTCTIKHTQKTLTQFSKKKIIVQEVSRLRSIHSSFKIQLLSVEHESGQQS